MLLSRVCGLTPNPTDNEPCGSKSTSSTLPPRLDQRRPQVDRGGRLADPALLVGHGDDQRILGTRLRGLGIGQVGKRTTGGTELVGSLRPAAGQPAARCGHLEQGGVTTDARGCQLECPQILLASERPLAIDADMSTLPPLAVVYASRARGCAAPVHLAQMVDRHQGVDLGGGHRGVPQQFLDDAHVGPSLEQVCGVAVTQAVGADVGDPGAVPRRADDAPGALPRQPLAPAVEQQGGARDPRPASPGGPAAHEPRVDRGARVPPSGTSRSLLPLPNNRSPASVSASTRMTSSTSSPHTSEIRAPVPYSSSSSALLEQPVDGGRVASVEKRACTSASAQRLGQAAAQVRRADPRGGVGGVIRR